LRRGGIISRVKKLSEADQGALLKSIEGFREWLMKALPRATITNYKAIRCVPPSRDDWIMWVDDEKDEVHFNPYVISKCSVEYFELIVIHECFHLFVQDLPNKSDARMIKHGFGESIMKMLDIEADYYTALYYKDVKNASLIDVLTLYAEGSQVFGDPRVLTPKMERFIGSVLSICNVYFMHPNKSKIVEADLFLPTLDGIHTDETLYVVISRNFHFMLDEIKANAQDFAELKKAYTNTGGLTISGYVVLLVTFAAKALGHEVPAKIKRQMKSLATKEAVHRRRSSDA
jgi:hypothetical protein